MSFEKIRKHQGRGGRIVNRAACFASKGGTRITLSPDILDRLGNPSTVEVMIGSGENAGSVLLRPSSSDADFRVTKARQRLRSVVIRSKLLGLAENFPTTPVSFEISGGDLIVRLPDVRAARHPKAA